jgi:hypothetical protein
MAEVESIDTLRWRRAIAKRAGRPARNYMDVFCQVEHETGGTLDSEEFTRRVDQRCRALGIKS